MSINNDEPEGSGHDIKPTITSCSGDPDTLSAIGKALASINCSTVDGVEFRSHPDGSWGITGNPDEGRARPHEERHGGLMHRTHETHARALAEAVESEFGGAYDAAHALTKRLVEVVAAFADYETVDDGEGGTEERPVMPACGGDQGRLAGEVALVLQRHRDRVTQWSTTPPTEPGLYVGHYIQQNRAGERRIETKLVDVFRRDGGLLMHIAQGPADLGCAPEPDRLDARHRYFGNLLIQWWGPRIDQPPLPIEAERKP